MAKKPVTPEVTDEVADMTEVVETPEVVVAVQAEVVEERKPSAQTLAEMEAGRAALAARLLSAIAEKGE